MKKTARGFTLVELLVVIAILVILALAGIVLMKPQEMVAKGRDANRLADMNNIHQAINIAVQESSKSGNEVLCTGSVCAGASFPVDASTRKSDGTGWVKVDLSQQASMSMPTLPVDPTNNATLHYSYESDGKDWEINAVLESETYKAKMADDGGDNTGVYEVGSKLDLIN